MNEDTILETKIFGEATDILNRYEMRVAKKQRTPQRDCSQFCVITASIVIF